MISRTTGIHIRLSAHPATAKDLRDRGQCSGCMRPEELFYRIFESLPRQGPGCLEATRKVFLHLPPLPDNAAILDIGCGSGAQTRPLAALTSGRITAVDNHQPFLDALAARAEQDGLQGRIRPVRASMDNLPFGQGQFDLIWSEGAIFIIGFEQGLRTWKPFVKGGGFLVVSDAAWFEPDPPRELVAWWKKQGYLPLTEPEKAVQVRNAGLEILATERLPEAGWWEHYYVPMLEQVAAFREIYGMDPELAGVLDSFEKEAEMYRRYRRYYGYTFFVMRAP
jgi:SAM-dependent methyltransferase